MGGHLLPLPPPPEVTSMDVWDWKATQEEIGLCRLCSELSYPNCALDKVDKGIKSEANMALFV